MNPGICYTCRFETEELTEHSRKDGGWERICFHCWLVYDGDIVEPQDYVHTPEKLEARVAFVKECDEMHWFDDDEK